MKRMYLDGRTLAEIGQKCGLTRERVRQILSKQYGIRREDGGESERARRRKRAVEDRQNVKCLRIKGCTLTQYRELKAHPDKPIQFYTRSKINWKMIVGDAGPKSDIKLWDWWRIWQESGHWGDRGRGNGFRMCRKDSSKGFTLDNVQIKTGVEASVEAMQRYWDNHRVVSVPPSTRYWFSPVA